MTASIIQTAVESHDAVLAKEALREIDLRLGSTLDSNERVYLFFSAASCCGILRDFKRAREHLFLALQQQPDNPDTKLSFEFIGGLLCQEEGNYSAALERLTSVLSDHASRLKESEFRFMYEDIQLRRAFLLVTLSQFEDAIAIFREALSFNLADEDRGNALAGLGRCYCETDEWVLAKECLGQALASGLTKEYERQSHFFFGMACFYTDDLIEAKREFEICEERVAEFDLSIVDVYRWLSSVSGRLGETAESERYARLAKIV